MRKTAGAYNDGLIVMSDSELDYAAEVILEKLGSTEQEVADIIFDTDIGDNIGTFTDNYANGAIDSHPANTTTLSDTYTLYQNTGSASESSIIMPAKLDGASGIKPQTDTDLNNSIITRAINKIAEANSTFGEAGTYYITSNTTGTPVATGTWKTVSTVYDEITNDAADDGDKVTYNLYRRTSSSLSGDSEDRPMTIDASTPSHIKEMTDAQLQELAQRLRNRIIATGIGTYALQATAPGTGTWVSRGTITDRVPTINSVSYSRGDQYTRRFTGQYDRLSVGYAREYNTAPNVYVRSVYGTGNFTSTRFERQFIGTYARITIGPAYNPIYQSPTYQRAVPFGNYVNTYGNNLLSTAEQNDLYAQGVFAPPTIYGNNKYARAASTQYGTPSPIYNRSTSANYFEQYVREPGTGVGLPGQPDVLQFSRVFYRENFTRLVTGPTYFRTTNTYRADVFQRQFTRIFTAQYQRQFTRGQFTRGFTRIFSAQYERQFARAQYSINYSRQFNGPQYTGNFFRGAPADAFNRATTGPNYTRQFTRIFSSTPATQFSRIVTGPQYIADYARGPVQYFTIYRRDSYAAVYAGPNYTDGYTNFQRTFARSEFFRDPFYGYQRGPAGLYAGYYRGQYQSTGFNRESAQYQGIFARILYGQFYARANEVFALQYTRIFSANYDRGPVPNYTTGPQYDGPAYTRIFVGTYNTPYSTLFQRKFERAQYAQQFSRLYTGPQYTRITPGQDFSRGTQYTGQYDGPLYARITTGPQYDGNKYATVYLSGTIQSYVRQFTGQYRGIYSEQYSRVFSGNYDRLVPGPQYASDFDVYARGYTAQYEGTYSRGDQYTREFAGNTVRSNNDVAFTETTTTLWLRVA